MFLAQQDRLREQAPDANAASSQFDPSVVYTLPQLVDIAESRSPETREAWHGAQQRAAALGVAKSEGSIQIAKAFLSGIHRTSWELLLYNQFALQYQGIALGGVSVDYTVFDFGARLDRVHEQKDLLQAANFAFNDAHRRLIYAVTQDYYQLLSAAGQRRAAEANLKSAEAVSEATQARYDNGLATLPDVAEAKSVAAQATYDLQIRIGEEPESSGNAGPAFP